MKLDPKNSFQNAANTSAFVMPSAWFEDFSFGRTMFEALNGNAEALSGVGTGIADVALEERVKLEAERRKEDDPAGDASMIAELGAQQREELSEMQSVTYSDGQFHMFGMDIDEEDMDAVVDGTLENIDEVAARHNLDAQQKADLTTMLMAYKNADTPEEKAEILGEIAGAQPETAREMANDADKTRQHRSQNNLTGAEAQERTTEQIGNADTYVDAQASVARQDGYSVTEANDHAETTLAVRNRISNAGNPFGYTRSPRVRTY